MCGFCCDDVWVLRYLIWWCVDCWLCIFGLVVLLMVFCLVRICVVWFGCCGYLLFRWVWCLIVLWMVWLGFGVCGMLLVCFYWLNCWWRWLYWDEGWIGLIVWVVCLVGCWCLLFCRVDDFFWWDECCWYVRECNLVVDVLWF